MLNKSGITKHHSLLISFHFFSRCLTTPFLTSIHSIPSYYYSDNMRLIEFGIDGDYILSYSRFFSEVFSQIIYSEQSRKKILKFKKYRNISLCKIILMKIISSFSSSLERLGVDIVWHWIGSLNKIEDRAKKKWCTLNAIISPKICEMVDHEDPVQMDTMLHLIHPTMIVSKISGY